MSILLNGFKRNCDRTKQVSFINCVFSLTVYSILLAPYAVYIVCVRVVREKQICLYLVKPYIEPIQLYICVVKLNRKKNVLRRSFSVYLDHNPRSIVAVLNCVSANNSSKKSVLKEIFSVFF